MAGERALAEHTPRDAAAGRLGPLPAGSLGSPSCHLPLQSISGSCMWVTQQHCSQAQEAAAELKGSRRSSECCKLLLPSSLDRLPYVLWEIPEPSRKPGFG